jgi:hypothetical protein
MLNAEPFLGMTCDIKAGRCEGSQYQLLLVNLIKTAPVNGNSIQVERALWYFATSYF